MMKNIMRSQAIRRNQPLRNQKGLLTLDFIFALLMMIAFSAILFAFSMTFTAVEIAQYTTFASARAYFGAHTNEQKQKEQGTNKFKALVRGQGSPLGAFFRNGWFTLSDVQIKDFSSEFSNDPSADSDTFVGARTSFLAKILQMRFPLLGSTADDDMGASISTYLMREPTEEECMDFTTRRFENIQLLKSGFAQGNVDPSAYAPLADDGC